MGVIGTEVDGNAASGMEREFERVVSEIRAGSGLNLLNITIRTREHCGPNFDDNLNYRPEAEV